jgi:hypothetical protein
VKKGTENQCFCGSRGEADLALRQNGEGAKVALARRLRMGKSDGRFLLRLEMMIHE